MNDQMITDELNRYVTVVDTVKGVSIDKQSRVFEYASDEIGDTMPLIHLMTQMDMLHAVQGYMAATLDPRQFEGMPQACVKLENDMTGRVSESQKHFQLGTQFRETPSEHSTHEHDIQSTRIEHHH